MLQPTEKNYVKEEILRWKQSGRKSWLSEEIWGGKYAWKILSELSILM